MSGLASTQSSSVRPRSYCIVRMVKWRVFQSPSAPMRFINCMKCLNCGMPYVAYGSDDGYSRTRLMISVNSDGSFRFPGGRSGIPCWWSRDCSLGGIAVSDLTTLIEDGAELSFPRMFDYPLRTQHA